MKIEFLELEKKSSGFLKPVPTINSIPNWYKKTKPIKFLKAGGYKDMTVKKCIPVLDSFTTGYYLVTQFDMYYQFDEELNESSFSFDKKKIKNPNDKYITMHPFDQIDQMELIGDYYEYAYKWSNPYVIKTPPGYSCIFTQPFNQIFPFYTLTGVVDTDSHPVAVQFPFLMRKGFNGLIKSGTPIVQIIPFKRDDWEMSVVKTPNKIEIQDHSKGEEDFHKSRYDENGNLAGGEYKKRHRKVKRFN